MTTFTCFEHETLKIGDEQEGRTFLASHFNALEAWSRRQTNLPYFTVVHKGIKFAQWVGVLQVGNVAIEVLPKADRTGDKLVWKRRLLRMLKESRHLDLRVVDEASQRLQSHTLLDLVFERFLDHAEGLLEVGLVKRYRQVGANRTAVKGRIDTTRQATLNAAHKERTYTYASEYDRINTWNVILFQAARSTATNATQARLRSRAQSLLVFLPEELDKEIQLDIFDKLVYDRKTEAYRPMNLYAKLILSMISPDLSSGATPVLAWMFDMNDLWEEWLAVRLRPWTRGHAGYFLTTQQPKTFWKVDSSGTRRTVRPDIVIYRTGGPSVIIDTKWKLRDRDSPSDADLKQMFVYNVLFKCEHSFLVYPRTGIEDEVSGTFTFGSTRLTLLSVSCDEPERDFEQFDLKAPHFLEES